MRRMQKRVHNPHLGCRHLTETICKPQENLHALRTDDFKEQRARKLSQNLRFSSFFNFILMIKKIKKLITALISFIKPKATLTDSSSSFKVTSYAE